MTKKELEARIERLERELRAATQQLNNHICDRARPVYIQPPYIQPADGTARPWPWPGTFWNVQYGNVS